jgi:carboxyl-terminal processing protease
MKNIKNKKSEIQKIILEKKEKFNNNKFQTSEVLFLIIITAIIGFLFGFVYNRYKTTTIDEYAEEIIDNYNYIVDNYYEDVDKEALLSGAIDGMLSSLGDDYSSLISQEGNSTFYTTLEGSYDGIGIEIYNNSDNNIVILAVLEGSPAEAAGLQAGDIVKQIDDTNMLDNDISKLTKYVKENIKDSYTIIIERDGEEHTFTINRTVVTIKSVAYKIFEKENKKIGYIYISIFSNTTSSQFASAISDLESQGIDSLIIDVRENTGGHLTTASLILSQLMDSKHVIYQIEKDDKATKYYSTGTTTKEYPIVVLQNNDSASASELLSAALKESYGATIIGEKSYGKGTVQEMIQLSNGDNYKFTTKKWLTPKGNWINETGVEPDIEVSLDDNYSNDPTEDNDNQLQTAIKYLLEK